MEWISVKDRLPKSKSFVLVANINNVEAPVTIAIKTYNGLEFKILEVDQYTEEVTHWMPLPKKPTK